MPFLTGALAVRVFLCFAFAYLLSFAFRSVNAVIAPSLMADIRLSNADLGLLSSAYFLTFAAMQLPLGIWLDKYGPRRTESCLLLIAAAGAAIFAASTSLAGLWLGRALIGIGVSACLMAAYKAYRQWFAPQQQSRLASLMLVAGTGGALTATVPVNAALSVIGWRGVFWVMGGLILLAAAALWVVLRNIEASQAAASPAAAAPAAPQGGYREIFAHPYFRRVAPIAMVNSGCFSALQTLWIGPWMITTLGMNREASAEVLFIFNLCQLLSFLSLSWWAPRYIAMNGGAGWRVTRVTFVSLCGAILIQGMFITLTAPWTWMLWLALAMFTTVTPVLQTSVSMSFPASLAGRASSAYNFLAFASAFVMQWGIGLLIDAFESMGYAPAQAMRAAFGVCLLAQAVTMAWFAMRKAEPTQP